MAGKKKSSLFLIPAVLLLLLGGVASAGGSQNPGRPQCGPPPEAPGFETPARPGVVPDVACMDLQLGQDKLQAAGYYAIRSQDGSGYRRQPAFDRNWAVVSQDPAPGTRLDTDATVTLSALRYGDPDAPPVFERTRPGPVPRLACFDLQEAQDTLQSAGFGNIASEDASGQGRGQVADRNWTVVGQRPPPGVTVEKATRMVLNAVLDGERSPCR